MGHLSSIPALPMSIIRRAESCKKCGQNQWYVPLEYFEKPDLPEMPISGPKVAKVKAQIRKIEIAHKKRIKQLKKNAVCAVCSVPGGADLLRGVDTNV